jgi:hypothetical protein
MLLLLLMMLLMLVLVLVLVLVLGRERGARGRMLTMMVVRVCGCPGGVVSHDYCE